MQPLKLGFDIDCSEPFMLLIKSFFLERPIRSPREPQWRLDKVLDLLKSDRFSVYPCLKDLTMKVVFLIGLGAYVRIIVRFTLCLEGILLLSLMKPTTQ